MSSMGLGRIGNPKVVFKRKFRWTLAIETPVGLIPASFVKVASRPKLSVDATEINYLNATTWIPGKAKWESINVTYYDVADASMAPLWNWIATIYNFQGGLTMSEKPGWNATALLSMYDGCGTVLESWIMGSVFPESVDFGGLDYGDSAEASIELQLRYSEVLYAGGCGSGGVSGLCVGC